MTRQELHPGTTLKNHPQEQLPDPYPGTTTLLTPRNCTKNNTQTPHSRATHDGVSLQELLHARISYRRSPAGCCDKSALKKPTCT